MTSFVLVLSFAVTVITLNHLDWFATAGRTTQAQGSADGAWTNTGAADVGLTLISITGLVPIRFVHKHRAAGIVLLLPGGLLAAPAYTAWVP